MRAYILGIYVYYAYVCVFELCLCLFLAAFFDVSYISAFFYIFLYLFIRPIQSDDCVPVDSKKKKLSTKKNDSSHLYVIYYIIHIVYIIKYYAATLEGKNTRQNGRQQISI